MLTTENRRVYPLAAEFTGFSEDSGEGLDRAKRRFGDSLEVPHGGNLKPGPRFGR